MTPAPGGAPPATGAPATDVGNAAPPADVLYNNALRDYNSGKYDLSSQEFGDYIKYYSNTDLAANAQFYLADIEYRQGNFEAAVKDLSLIHISCGKKKAAPPPPPPPPSAPAPTASLTANPNALNAGQATTLIWKTD